jgi:HEAT repeat protein
VRDPDPGVRRLAIANLWENDEAGLIPVLLEILRHDPDHRVRAESARALGKFVYQVEVDGKHADLRASLEALLLDSARAGEIEVRVTSLESLGHSSRAEVAPLIEEAYRSDSDRFREAAVLAMGRSGDARWETYVMAEMRSPSPSLRREAARAAGELELRKSVSELVELLQDTHTEVLHASIWALGQIGGKPSEKALRRFLRSRPEESLAAAAEESLEYLAFLEGTRDLEAGVRALDESR